MSQAPQNDAGIDALVQQAASYLRSSVHNEVDGAHVGTTQVLATSDRSRVYAGAIVQGPLRAYVATAWGAAGQVSHKEIASYPDPSSAQSALAATLAHQQKQGLAPIGNVDAET